MPRADRRHRTARIVARRERLARHLELGLTAARDPGGRELARLRGRWRNLAPLDCGRPRCGLCSGPRFRAARHRQPTPSVLP